MFRGKFISLCLIAFQNWFLCSLAGAGTPPPGFAEQKIGSGWSVVVGLTFDEVGRLYAWEKSGKVWRVDADGAKASTPFIDIHEEVGDWGDHGLLGFALSPDFFNDGHVYLFYVVDRHHARHCRENASGVGEPVCAAAYDPAVDEYFAASIGRITRYTARMPAGDTDYRNAVSVDRSSRKVLLGETIETGCPVLYYSHGVGTLLFAHDGSLIATCGDGASYSMADGGGAVESFFQDALNAKIIAPKENVGAFRAQLIDSLSGKILRLDPQSGDGLASNPYFDATAPRAARSRVWALGLRNPYRITLKPGSGGGIINAGTPGTFHVGDVGWSTWEELNIVSGPKQNFGWPLYEGMTAQPEYMALKTANPDVPNPLYNGRSCAQRYLNFQDLLIQDTQNPSAAWNNPCSSTVNLTLPENLFIHTRPVADWMHTETGPARWSSYYLGAPVQTNIGTQAPDGALVQGAPFGGNSSVGGVWYVGGQFPPEYAHNYFHADFSNGWIKRFVFDATGTLTAVKDFIPDAGGVVDIQAHPLDGSLYYISWGADIVKVSYSSANAASDVQLNLRAWPELPGVGDMLSYIAEVRNAGPAPATSVTLTDLLPAPLHPSNAPYTTQGSCTLSGSNLRCSLGTVAAGSSIWVVVAVQPSRGGDLVNTMTVQAAENDPNPADNSRSLTTRVQAAQADVQLSQRSGPEGVKVGELLYFVAEVKNAGPAAATNVTLTDPLPAPLDPTRPPFTTQGSCASSGSNLNCALGTLAPGASAWVVIYTQPDRSGSLTNTMTVSAAENDPNILDNSRSATVTVLASAAQADLQLIQRAGPQTINVGGLLYYVAEVKNAGPATATNVTLSDALPVPLDPTRPPFTTQGSCASSGSNLHCQLGTLAPEATAWVLINAQPDRAGSAVNTMSVSARETDPVTANNQQTTQITVNP